MKAEFNNLNITAITTALPNNKLELSSLAPEFGDIETNRIISSTGIEGVYIANEQQNTSDLCEAAARHLLKQLNIAPETIDGVIFVSQTPSYIMPATSASLQHKLGLKKDAVALDTNYGCSGYIYGLYQAAMLINSGGCKRVLLCVGDVISRLIHPEDRDVRFVFGDAGSATLIEQGNNTLAFNLKTDGSGSNHLIVPKKSDEQRRAGYLYMNGAAVMEFVLREVPSMINQLIEDKNWQKQEVDLFALHQANHFILTYLRKKLQVEVNKVPIAIKNTGNTGPASIPLLFSIKGNELAAVRKLEKVIMCGFGVGLSWASVATNLINTQFFEPIHVN